MKRENRKYCFYKNRISLILIMLILSSCIGKIYAQATGFANVTISTATTNGSWSPTSASAVNTFIPTGTSTTTTWAVAASEIVSRLATGDVIISTSCSTCSGAGTISITSSINVNNSLNSKTLFINARGNIYIYNSINFSSNSSSTTFIATSLDITSANGNIISATNSGTINTSRTTLEDNERAGNVKLTASNGSVQINADINTNAPTSKASCIGGNVTILGNAGITINANITSTGNTYGILSVTDNNASVSYSIDLSNLGQTSGKKFTIGSFEKLGTGVFQLNGATNVWAGNTTISEGILKLGALTSIPTTSSIVFNGGDFQPNGFDHIVNSFSILKNSSITFDATNACTITFKTITSSASMLLTINGWQGSYSKTALTKFGSLPATSSNYVKTTGSILSPTLGPPAASAITQLGQILTSSVLSSGGLKGRLVSTNTLLASELLKIQFYNSPTYYSAQQINSKEIIPGIAK